MTDKHEHVQHTHIGGQALLEGVMMRGKLNWAVAVRRPDGGIHVEAHKLKSGAKPGWRTWPIVRGCIVLFESLSLGLKAFSISAQYAGEEEEEQLSEKEISFSLIFGVVLAVGLFVLAPLLLTNLVLGPFYEGNPQTDAPFVWNIVNGVLRVLAFFAYIFAISRVKEIQRVFSYHGAEHKTIHAYEHHIPLDTKLIQKYSTAHMRCGTSFLLMVMVVAIVVYALVPLKGLVSALGIGDMRWLVTLVVFGIHLLFLPIIAGLAYEVIKFAGNHSDNPFVRVLLWPGLMLQRMTTNEPTDDMIEVAVAATLPVLEAEGLMDGVELSDEMRAALRHDHGDELETSIGLPESPAPA